ncbi:MAG: type I restriction-modification system subunit M N-terminal domain-containing protein, partial [Halothiobacillaceae bacterium]
MNENHAQTASFIWSVADLLRGDFKQSQYGRVILPFTLLRRLECVLEANKARVLETQALHADKPPTVLERMLLRVADQPFYNASPLSLATLSDTQTEEDLISYVESFSPDAREIFEHFHFEDFVGRLAANNLLYQVVQRFAAIDLHPRTITNYQMGL